MATKRRRYGEACGFAHAGELIGERWAFLVIRELLLGPKRFTDLRAGIPRISPNVLGQRLRELEESGLVRRRRLPPPAGSKVYELTDWGREIEPVALQLGVWASRSPGFPRDGGTGPDSLVLELKALFDAEAAGDLEAVYELRFGGDHFRVAIANGEIEASRGGADDADVTIDTDPDVFQGILAGAFKPKDAEKRGELAIEGDRKAAARLFGLFPLPEPARAEPAVAAT